jgi:flagellar protein FlaG
MPSVFSASPAPSLSTRMVTPVAVRALDAVAATRAPGTEPTLAPAPDKTAKTDAQTPAKTSPAAAMSKAELVSQVHALQDKMNKLNPALAFVVDQDSGRALIQLTDRATKEVIQQFPTEAAMQISKALDRYQKGQLIHLTV